MDPSVTSSLCEVILLAAKKSTLKKAVFSKSNDKNIVKAVMSPVLLGGAPCLQVEYFHHDNKATHKNISLSDSPAPFILEMIGAFSQVNVITVLGECEYRVSNKGKSILLGGDKLIKRLAESQAVSPVDQSTNNREKRYILNGTEPLKTIYS